MTREEDEEDDDLGLVPGGSGALVVRCGATSSDGASVVRYGATCSDGALVVLAWAKTSWADGLRVEAA